MTIMHITHTVDEKNKSISEKPIYAYAYGYGREDRRWGNILFCHHQPSNIGMYDNGLSTP